MKKYALYLLLLAAVSACIYPYDVELDSDPAKTVVVDGEIVVGGTSRINLSYMVPLNAGATGRRANGMAHIEGEDGTVYKPNSSAMTSSLVIPMDAAPAGQRYRAVITVDGETYSSDWLDPVAPPVIRNVSFSAGDYLVTVSVDMDPGEAGSGYIGITSEECWEFHSDFYPESFIMPDTWNYYIPMSPYPFYWCWRYNNNDGLVLVNYSGLAEGSSIIGYPVQVFPRTDSRNHRKYSILVKARTLSKEAYDYIHHMDEQSNSGSNLFTPDPGQMTGNLHCESNHELQVMGMLYASQVTTKRAFLSSIYSIRVPEDDAMLVHVAPEMYPAYYYEKGYRPIKTVTIENKADVGWGPERCINCILAGGTQEEPSFWRMDPNYESAENGGL